MEMNNDGALTPDVSGGRVFDAIETHLNIATEHQL